MMIIEMRLTGQEVSVIQNWWERVLGFRGDSSMNCASVDDNNDDALMKTCMREKQPFRFFCRGSQTRIHMCSYSVCRVLVLGVERLSTNAISNSNSYPNPCFAG